MWFEESERLRVVGEVGNRFFQARLIDLKMKVASSYLGWSGQPRQHYCFRLVFVSLRFWFNRRCGGEEVSGSLNLTRLLMVFIGVGKRRCGCDCP